MSDMGELPDRMRPTREPYYSEKTTEERIEALRDTCIGLANALVDLSKVVEKLEQHQHATDGKILVSIYAPERYCVGRGLAHRLER